jgi:hypothetical protein
MRAPVAQLDRVLPSEGKGQWFESTRARQFFYLASSSEIARTKAGATSEYHLISMPLIVGDNFERVSNFTSS